MIISYRAAWWRRKIDSIGDDSYGVLKAEGADLLIFLFTCRVNARCGTGDSALQKMPEYTLFAA
jgi:hypothetical protein